MGVAVVNAVADKLVFGDFVGQWILLACIGNVLVGRLSSSKFPSFCSIENLLVCRGVDYSSCVGNKGSLRAV